MRRARATGERGQASLLIIGFTVVAAMLAAAEPHVADYLSSVGEVRPTPV